MTDVVALVEGQTEQTFVRDLLAPHLVAHGVFLWSRLPGHRVRSGGVRPWAQVRADILRTLKERAGRICTTMFDFYGMPKDWPGRADVARKPPHQKGDHVECALLDNLAVEAGPNFRRELFIPYVQVHEFEAILFADVDQLADVLADYSAVCRDRLRERFKKILDDAGEAEGIDDGYDTCPSRRISALVPAYRKPLYGPIIAGRIGLEALRQACPHFARWVERLELLGSTT